MMQHPSSLLLPRRGILQVGQLSAFGIGLSSWRHVAASPKAKPRAKNCILIWLDGGPSHLETFDPKPDAPMEVRGPLTPIRTSLAGISVGECLPGLASRISEFALIRSMTSPLGEHNLGTHFLLTGHRPTPSLQYPAFHTVANQLSADQKSILPKNVAIPEYRVGGANFDGVGFLPRDFGPFSIGGDPASKDFRVRHLLPGDGLTLHRINRRRAFSQRLADFDRGVGDVDASMSKAFQLVSSTEAREAFDLEKEKQETRERYGRKSVGQSCLLARRLIERGVRFVTVNHRGWDTHNNLYTRLKEGYTGARVGVGLIPSLDLAVSALIDDLKASGLLSETLILVMGEFGRTPKINPQGGRDHWPRVFSIAAAGGGIRGGQVIGESDSVGESPKDRPVSPSDLTATVYTLLGIHPATEISTDDGRPVRIAPNGSAVIQELLT